MHEFPSLLSPTLVVEFHKVKDRQVIKPKKLNYRKTNFIGKNSQIL
jgi:hypothetical protein